MIEIMRLSVPLTVWITGFSALYGLHGLTCSRHWPADIDARIFLLAASVVAIAAQGLCLIVIYRAASPSQFVQTTATALAVSALVAAIWSMLPLMATSICM